MSGVGSWALVFVGFSLLIVLHEAGHFAAAKATGMRVEKFFLFFGPKLFSWKRGETEYGVGTIPIGGYVRISGMTMAEELDPDVEHRAYHRQAVWKRIVTIVAGPAVNIGLAFVIFFFGFFYFYEVSTSTVAETVPGSPAARALRQGDRILAIDGKAFRDASQETRLERFANTVNAHKCSSKPTQGCRAQTPVVLRLRRDGHITTISIAPKYEKAIRRMRLGFAYGAEPASLDVASALSKAGSSMWLVTRESGAVFSHLFESRERKEVSGVVGISDAAHEAIGVGAFPALMLLALVSLSLGLFNLLPVLPLDGGHIFWALLEKLRGQPVSVRVIERATVVGFALAAVLMFIGLSNDIGRLGNGGFHVR